MSWLQDSANKESPTARRIRLTVAVLVVCAICFFLYNDVIKSQTNTAGAPENVTGLPVGTCFDSSSDRGSQGASVEMVTGVSCTQPHGDQVLADLPMTDKTYPSDSVMQNEGDAVCSKYWGSLPASGQPSDATGAFFFPATADEFTHGNRSIVCVWQSPTEALDTSVTGN